MAEQERVAHLECRWKGAKKFYNVELLKSGSNWSVRAHWGRIGTKGSYQDKGTFSNHWRAENEVTKLVQQKKSKNYTEVKVTKKKLTKVNTSKGKAPATPKEKSLDRFSDLLE